MAEKSTSFRKLRQIQARIRRKSGNATDVLPKEDEQFLVWLDGIDHYFFVPLKTASDLTLELEMIGVLREAFMHDKKVKLGYRQVGDNRYISAAWVQHG